ncbi:MAG: peptidase [Microbacteriaceae bacterium]|nr:peptidase [Microbacteriaceae bacterium]
MTAVAAERHRARSVERSFGHYLGLSFSVVVLVAVLAIVALTAVVPRVAGGTALTVLTRSMEPGLPPGTLIVIRPVPIDDIRVGQVVTYQLSPGEPAVVSHRVVSRSTDTLGRTTFVTRGDNNDLPDAAPVSSAQVRGVLWYSIPLLGWVNTAMGSAGGRWLIPAVAVLLFLYAGVMLARAAVERRRSAR